MQEILENNLPSIHELCKAHHVRELYAFGSVVSNGFNNTSDVDLLVTFKSLNYGDYADNYFELAELLEEVLKRKVDLITDKSLSNPYFVRSVEKTKKRLYG